MTRTQITTQAVPVIASRLREARLQAGISQKAMGILAGIDEFTSSARVNQYEQGKHIPDFLTLEKFASVLNVPTEFFYARDDVMAEMLLLFAQQTQKQKSQLIAHLKKLNVDR
jgi:transcriptional regulator with XRE-family HTH domain